VVEDPDAHVLEGWGDLVGRVDILLAGVALLSGVKFVRSGKVRQVAFPEEGSKKVEEGYGRVPAVPVAAV